MAKSSYLRKGFKFLCNNSSFTFGGHLTRTASINSPQKKTTFAIKSSRISPATPATHAWAPISCNLDARGNNSRALATQNTALARVTGKNARVRPNDESETRRKKFAPAREKQTACARAHSVDEKYARRKTLENWPNRRRENEKNVTTTIFLNALCSTRVYSRHKTCARFFRVSCTPKKKKIVRCVRKVRLRSFTASQLIRTTLAR